MNRISGGLTRRGAAGTALVALGLATTSVGLLSSGTASADPKDGGPAGNNGTVKVENVGVDSDDTGKPENNPHLPCTFTVEWWNFEQGDYYSQVSFELKSPTLNGRTMKVTGPAKVFIGEDPANGAGAANGRDASATYTLHFTGDPQPKQGFHVKLTTHNDGSQGADTKYKTFWVGPCDDDETTPPTEQPSESNPTESNPAESPSESNPYETPSESNPAESPSESNPYETPSESNPAESPSESNPYETPSESNPTVLPSESNPTVLPSESNPTVLPSESNPTVLPSESNPTASNPTVLPTESSAPTESLPPTVLPTESSVPPDDQPSTTPTVLPTSSTAPVSPETSTTPTVLPTSSTAPADAPTAVDAGLPGDQGRSGLPSSLVILFGAGLALLGVGVGFVPVVARGKHSR